MYPNDPNQPSPPQEPQPLPQQAPSQFGAQQPVQSVAQPQQAPLAPTIPVQNPLPPQPHNNFNATPQPMVVKRLPVNNGPLVFRFNEWMKQHWRLTILTGVLLIVVGITIYQIIYPNARLLPGTSVDGIALGGMRKEEAATKLNTLYGDVEMSIYFGKNDAAFMKSKIKDMGISVVNNDRIAAMEYPFYLRLIPGSIFWANNTMKLGNLAYEYDKSKIQSYTEGTVGDTCTISAKDATLKLIDSQLQLVKSVPGGECDITEFQKAISEAMPISTPDAKENQLRIDSTEKAAAVDDDKARELADSLNKRLKDPMPMSLGSNSESIPGRIVLSWLDFKSDVPEKSLDDVHSAAKLVFAINNDRMATYINGGIASKVVKKPGVSKIATTDFTETSRVNGAGGTALDMPKIVTSVTDYINNRTNQSVAVVHEVGPTLIYTRTYTPTSVGLKALLTQFAEDNEGTYGLAMTELSNVRYPRSASYNADAQFASAGIESLYIGYAAIMQQSEGELRPVEKISDERSVETCLKDMYIKFDSKCRYGFYTRLGYARVVQRGVELGLKNTKFADAGGVTSANDLHQVLIGLHNGTIGRAQGTRQLLSMSQAIRTNDGVPAGVSKGNVTHFIGDSETVKNDAAIVSSDKGVYALSIVSKDSSWEKIAALTKKIQDFKQMKIPKDAR
ncbi:MAG: serine hydrolase [Candidatus Saccharimonadales bacterium]